MGMVMSCGRPGSQEQREQKEAKTGDSKDTQSRLSMAKRVIKSHGKNPCLACFPGLPSSPSLRVNHGTATDGALRQYRGRPGQTQSHPKQLRAMEQFGLQATWRSFGCEVCMCLSWTLATRRLTCSS